MFYVDVETSAGAKCGSGPLTRVLSFSRRRGLDQVCEATLRVAASDPQTDQVQAGRYYHVYQWDPITGTKRDLGTWKHRQARISQDGDAAIMEIACYGLEIELVNESVYFKREWTNTATNTVVSALRALCGGWSDDTIDNPGNITVRFDGENILQAILAVANTWMYHFRQGTTARTLDFGAFGTDSGVRLILPRAARVALEENDLVALIKSVEVIEETDRIVNKLVPLGAGLGDTQLTIYGATVTDVAYPVRTGTNGDGSSYYYIDDGTSRAAYGTITAIFSATDVTPLANTDADLEYAKNVLYRKAVSYLVAHKDPLTVYGVTCSKLRTAVELGDKVRLIYRGVVTRDGTPYKFVDVDALQYVMAIEESWNEDDSEDTRLELSESGQWVENDGQMVAAMQQDLQVWKTHVMTYPCRMLDTRYEEMDSTHDVDVPVDIDSGVLYVNSCQVRFRTRPLRATATGAAADPGSTSGASSTATTESEAEVTPTTTEQASVSPTTTEQASVSPTSTEDGDHRHTMFYFDEAGGPTNWYRFVSVKEGGGYCSPEIAMEDAGFTGNIQTYEEAGDHTHDVTVPAHDHDVTIPAHDHDVTIPAHDHGMEHTHAISAHTHPLEYGIHDDTEYPDTVRLAIDGTDRTAALGGPWAVGGGAEDQVLDVTSYITGSALGLRTMHTLTFSCDSGQGTIETVVKLHLTVQGIAVA